ncbi:MAG TPA: coatomer subunit epsilon, partial [Silvibacterium sp.]|nr:coatomer subunit epsilon [Silvibacterium sp.]
MDTQARHALKQDKFVQATASGLSWIELHRSQVIRASVIGVVILAAIIGSAAFYKHRTAQASLALGQALEIYNSPLRQPGEPEDGSFSTAADRAKAANRQFVDVAKRYDNLEPGKVALYFA